MAASGFTPISIYHSSTPAAVPDHLDLQDGELAINIYDGKLYYRNSAGAVQLLASNGTSAPVLTVSFGSTGLTPSTATAGAISVAGTLVAANGGTGQSSYTTGDLLYASASTALSKLTLGTTNYVLTAGASAPQYVAQSTLSVGSATNLAGGTTGALHYQSGAGASTFLSLGTTNYVLTAGASAPRYVAQSTLSVGSATTAGSVTNSLTFNNGGAGDTSGSTYNGSVSKTISYNSIGAPKTDGTDASGTWIINITGNAGTATSANAIANTGGWAVTPSGTKLYFSYNGVNVASLDSTGNFIAKANVTAYGTP